MSLFRAWLTMSLCPTSNYDTSTAYEYIRGLLWAVLLGLAVAEIRHFSCRCMQRWLAGGRVGSARRNTCASESHAMSRQETRPARLVVVTHCAVAAGLQTVRSKRYHTIRRRDEIGGLPTNDRARATLCRRNRARWSLARVSSACRGGSEAERDTTIVPLLSC